MSILPHTSLRTARTARQLRCLFELCPRSRSRSFSRPCVEENDIVLLTRRDTVDNKPILTKPLRPTGKILTHRGVVDHASLIGKAFRDVVYTNRGVPYRIHQPTLAEYVRFSPRTVTPIYPADANLIVSLLDIHPSIPGDGVKDETFEIFEAGTGHGALTLHLARAIHGFNPAPPRLPSIHSSNKPSIGELSTQALEISKLDEDALAIDASSTEKPTLHDRNAPSCDQDPQPIKMLTTGPEHKSIEEIRFEAYLPSRRAVIHTLDISRDVSKHAQSTIRKFRRGLYYHNIDFQVGTIPDYLSSRLATTDEPFLEHTILDLPNPHHHLEMIGHSLKPNGFLIVFCPSITQIVDCVNSIREKKLPFQLQSVLELGAGVGVGGKEWDVRAVKPRAVLKAQAEAQTLKEQREELEELDSTDEEKSLFTTGEDSGWEMVCRPKVGGLVSGGGFLALWRRMGMNSEPKARQFQSVDAVEMRPIDVNEPVCQPVGDPESERRVQQLLGSG